MKEAPIQSPEAFLSEEARQPLSRERSVGWVSRGRAERGESEHVLERFRRSLRPCFGGPVVACPV